MYLQIWQEVLEPGNARLNDDLHIISKMVLYGGIKAITAAINNQKHQVLEPRDYDIVKRAVKQLGMDQVLLFAKTVQNLQKLNKGRWDLHGKNIMNRPGTNQPVIVDPWHLGN